MRVMIPILATTYGESVTFKQNKLFMTLIYYDSGSNNHKALQQFIRIHCVTNYHNKSHHFTATKQTIDQYNTAG